MSLLVAVDTSAPSRGAIVVAGLLAGAAGEEPFLLHVSAEPPPLDRLADLYALAEPLQGRAGPARLRTAEGEPVAEISREARARACRWIVTGTRGKTEARGSEAGSVALGLMACAPAPVVAVRPAMDLDPPSTEARPAVALAVNGAGATGAAQTVARLLAAGLGARLLEAPAGLMWRASVFDHPDALAPAYLVIPIIPGEPVPWWVNVVLREEPVPVVLVSPGACTDSGGLHTG